MRATGVHKYFANIILLVVITPCSWISP